MRTPEEGRGGRGKLSANSQGNLWLDFCRHLYLAVFGQFVDTQPGNRPHAVGFPRVTWVPEG